MLGLGLAASGRLAGRTLGQRHALALVGALEERAEPAGWERGERAERRHMPPYAAGAGTGASAGWRVRCETPGAPTAGPAMGRSGGARVRLRRVRRMWRMGKRLRRRRVRGSQGERVGE